MPELPEVEIVRRGLQSIAEDAICVSVQQNRPDLRFPFPDHFCERLIGKRIKTVGRRAKYLIFYLDDGLCILSHLGMSGSYRIEGDNKVGIAGKAGYKSSQNGNRLHDHFFITVERCDGSRIRIIYNDPRRFGFILLVESGMLDEYPMLKKLGIEPTNNALSGKLLSKLFSKRRASLKTILLDQRVIVGLGNIYVCEALWRAGLSPLRKAATIATPVGKRNAKADALAIAINSVITEAIAVGGSSVRNYVHIDGTHGYFQHSFSVYDREGMLCSHESCKGMICRIAQGTRSTFFCPRCQR